MIRKAAADRAGLSPLKRAMPLLSVAKNSVNAGPSAMPFEFVQEVDEPAHHKYVLLSLRGSVRSDSHSWPHSFLSTSNRLDGRAVAIVGEPLCQASSQTGGALNQRQLRFARERYAIACSLHNSNP
jgi:hypothetical protein